MRLSGLMLEGRNGTNPSKQRVRYNDSLLIIQLRSIHNRYFVRLLLLLLLLFVVTEVVRNASRNPRSCGLFVIVVVVKLLQDSTKGSNGA